MLMRPSRKCLVGVLLVALAIAGGCGDDAGSGGEDRAAAPPTRPSGSTPPPTGANAEDSTVPPVSTPAERSHPWWKPVSTFKGDGATTTAPFDIEVGAAQWRVTWKCQTGTFSAVPVKQPGSPDRPLARDAACANATGSGFSSQTGRFALEITASGPWELTVDQQVDHALVEELLPEMAQATVLSTAALYNVDRTARGTARFYSLADGRRAVRLESFYVTANVDLEIRLSELAAPKTTDEIAKAPFAQVAFLKATLGSMNYLVPPEVDVTRYRSVVIWCEITNNAYGAGTLQA
jgi:hypothetical protein